VLRSRLVGNNGMSILSDFPDQIDAHQLVVLVEAGRTTSTYEMKQKIFSQGDVAESICFVQHGTVELTRTDCGADFVLGAATEGQFFGAACLDGAALRITSATAATQCRITSVTKQAMLAAISERPKFSRMFSDHLWYNKAASAEAVLSRLAVLAGAKKVRT
jgi:CRP/FNR family cyclic AMP-dependent transcriptional regulator